VGARRLPRIKRANWKGRTLGRVSAVSAHHRLPQSHCSARIGSASPISARRRQPPPGAPQRPVLQNTLRHFPDNVQTETLYLLKKVQTDDWGFTITPVTNTHTHTPAVHPSKCVLLTLPWFTRMVRRALDAHGRVPSFTTPLQMKFYMFTRERAFRIFRQLSCTSNTLNSFSLSLSLSLSLVYKWVIIPIITIIAKKVKFIGHLYIYIYNIYDIFF
jgi:hypothetical protein